MRASAPPTRLLLKEKKIIPTPSYFFPLDLQCKSNAFTDGNTKVLFVVVKFIYISNLFFFFLFSESKSGWGQNCARWHTVFRLANAFFFILEQKNSFRLFILFFGNFPHRLFCIADTAGPSVQRTAHPSFSKMEERGSKVIEEKALSADVRTAFIYTEVRYSRYFFLPLYFFSLNKTSERKLFFSSIFPPSILV